jgi:polyhydroxybutyrate depolymerase
VKVVKAASCFYTIISSALRRIGCLLGALLLFNSAAYAKYPDNEGGYHPAVPLDLYSRLSFEGQHRKYLVHVPPSYDGSTAAPLVVCLHGGGGDIGFAVRMFRFNEKADREGFIVAYPNGSGRMGDHLLTWNADQCCGFAKAHHMNDIGFIRSLLAQVEDDYHIDSKRVYVAGFSNGAMMAYKLACEMPEKFAAFAAVSGSMNGTEHWPALPISGMIVHGLGDRHIPVTGGGGKLAKWGFNVHAKPLDYAVKFWATADGCRSLQVESINNGEVQCRKYLGGKAGSEVIVYTIDGYKHSWPGGQRAWFRADKPCPDLSATDKCWEFFSRHTRDPNAEQLCHQEPDPLQHSRP